MSKSILVPCVVVVLAASTVLLGCPGDKSTTSAAPGIQPESERASQFLASVGTGTITVLPTLVRTHEGTLYWPASQETVAAFINERGLGIGKTADLKVDLSSSKGTYQWDMFQSSLELVGEQVAGLVVLTDYVAVLELLVTKTKNGGSAVGGIQCYIVDSKGEDAFSFLLNANEKLFKDAQLVAQDGSKASKEALIQAATQVALAALDKQIKLASAT